MDMGKMAEALIESDAAFREQFDRSSPNFHGGVDVPVPTGGARVPESMGGDAMKDWRDMPEVQPALEPEYPPEYHAAMATYEQFGKVKKAMSVLNKPVETVMKVRVQYKGAEGESKIALESRLRGEENNRDGALGSMKVLFGNVDSAEVSDRTRSAVSEVIERGTFAFEDRETFGEYMTVLQRCNQAIFADQKKLLQKIKDIKKAAAKAPDAAKGAEAADGEAAGAGAAPAAGA
uniref:Uncharacterized protein n=1 Tax=Alexandrium monilatum TaxID=311494 RepID=A0A7S4PXM3_9DINO|mmetsp:Transcript_53251/g.158772  ORF Transcript_53251/g.158772 Transcript_53251/m.158772 type:complete len:234 (+) Transcript_53251:79-780(+)